MAISFIFKVDLIEDDLIQGLVLDLDQPLRPTLIEIYIDNIFFHAELAVGLVHPQCFRLISAHAFQELTKKIGEVNPIAGAFSYRVPPYVPRDREVEIGVYADSRKQTLYHARTRLGLTATRILRHHFAAYPAVRTEITRIADGEFNFSGYCVGVEQQDKIVPQLEGGELVSFSIDSSGSKPLLTFTDPTGDLSFTAPQDLPSWSYSGSARANPENLKESRLFLKCANRPGVLGGLAGCLLIPQKCVREISNWKYPDNALMKRAMGFANRNQYYFGGYATFRMIERSLMHSCGRPLASFEHILDWGCGCGRLSQHLSCRTSAAVTAADIDGESVAWCQHNIEGARFLQVPFDPPTGLPDRGFDLAIGISVFTHLDECRQLAWLKELHRVLAPEGIAAVTIQSVHCLHLGDHLARRYRDLTRMGIDDGHIGSTLRDVVGEVNFEYYRETFHSHEYILRTWGQWFDILGIYIGSSFNFQDLVVMRRRAHVVAASDAVTVLELEAASN
jgi:SAM-dependent methyltransferase